MLTRFLLQRQEAFAAELEQLGEGHFSFSFAFKQVEVARNLDVDVIRVQELHECTEAHEREPSSLVVEIGFDRSEELLKNELILEAQQRKPLVEQDWD